MTNRYIDLVNQTFDFPQEGFEVKGGYLYFHDLPLKTLIDTYGTPFKLSYLPKITAQIEKARNWFKTAMAANDYQGEYHYCYCTKSSHFRYVMDEVLKNKVHIETSSAMDIDLVDRLFEQGKINKTTIIINNGFKPILYTKKISALINAGFKNVMPVLDNVEELEQYEQFTNGSTCKIGIRVATEEEPNFEFYTSRLGIPRAKVLDFYQEKIANSPKFQLKMLHFFVDKGIKDNMYYWNEFKKVLKLYCQLKKVCPSLKAINIGGGLPIKNSLGFEYDYPYMINEIVSQIKTACQEEQIEEPDIFTEFGKFTVGESGAVIFSVLGQKLQNDAELWYMIDNSIMNTLPDTWGIQERFLLLPINRWNNEYRRVNIGGLTCDNSDYYNAEAHINQLYLPKYNNNDPEPQYIGFFHTGAYQEALCGYGGIQHCLIPMPKHVLVDKDANGNLKHWLNFKEQKLENVLDLLGY